jgi:methylated-DNA-protein-cysteine methyltransferase-like protein
MSSIKPQYAQIWTTVQLIPKGKVACYGQIADLAGLPGRARLVGKALGKVPKYGWQEKLVPWYRVVNPIRKISFPMDNHYFQKQKRALQAEDVVVIGAKIKLKDFQWQPDLSEILLSLSF